MEFNPFGEIEARNLDNVVVLRTESPDTIDYTAGDTCNDYTVGDACIDCKSETGLTITLIDSIMATASILKYRGLNHPAIREAFKDLRNDPDLRYLLTKEF
jgi:hypothetical protein